jgi:hypothetical protein
LRLFFTLGRFVRAQLLFEWATNTPILFAHSSRRADKDLICRPAVSYIYDIFGAPALLLLPLSFSALYFALLYYLG